jgi:hypothetical protein
VNDESELQSGKDVLARIFRSKTAELNRNDDPMVGLFASRGVRIYDYADGFEKTIIAQTLNALCVYITCFCRANDEQDFRDGRLSQWRGYGNDGGYAIQFSRRKLMDALKKSADEQHVAYDLQDVVYSNESHFRENLLGHSSKFEEAYLDHSPLN